MNYKRYLWSFLITSTIFATAIVISNKLNEAKLGQVRAMEDKMSIDILSLETQFDLLQELSCTQISNNSILSSELSNLAHKLSYMESQRGTSDAEVIRLKRKYSLLQIKDLLLIQKISAKCGTEPTVILYFYSNAGDCKDCTKQGYVLTKLGDEHNSLRVYSFDANLDMTALNTLLKIHNIGKTYPSLVINGETYKGFKSLDEIQKLLPQLSDTDTSTSSKKVEQDR